MSKKVTLDEMREALVDHILNEASEETAEKAARSYVKGMSKKSVEDLYHSAIELPAQRASVVISCLRRIASDESVSAERFFKSLPEGWDASSIIQLASDIEDGLVVIEEACDDE